MKPHLSLLLAFSLVVSCSLAVQMRRSSLLDDSTDIRDHLTNQLCPYGRNATVLCNILANDSCFCKNAIKKDQVESKPVEPKYQRKLCNDNYFNYTHIVQISFKKAITDDTPNWLDGYMTEDDIELNLLSVFNVNRLDKSLRSRNYESMYNDLRFMRFSCNMDLVMSVFVGFKATANTTSENENVTLADLGYDVNGIKNTKFLDVVYLKSLSKDRLKHRMWLYENY